MVHLAGLRVMLVEDEFLIAMDIEDTLRDAGCLVSGPYGTLEGACAAAREAVVDVAILDIDLAGDEVFPAAAILAARGVPFLFHTGRPDRAALRTGFPGAPVCVKPTAPRRLLEILDRMMPLAA